MYTLAARAVAATLVVAKGSYPTENPQSHGLCRLAACLHDVYHTHMGSADLIRELKQAGWRLARVNGSHHVFTHPARAGIVVVPHPKKDLGTGLVKAIRQQAGI